MKKRDNEQMENRPGRNLVDRLILWAGALFLALTTAFLVYMPASDALANIRQTSELGAYAEAMHGENEEETNRMLRAARSYNKEILEEQQKRSFSYRGEQAEDRVYLSLLNYGGDGIMAELMIPSLDIDLPVVHGTHSEDLEYRCGHMYGTSLPIGGASTHAVLPAHTGLTTADLFTRITELKAGDVFYIRVLGEIHVYTVRNTTVVLPEEESPYLAIEKGHDLVTLYTCTPYGINDHRLLVIGERRYPNLKAESLGGEAVRLQSMNFKAIARAAALSALPVVIPAIYLCLMCRKPKKKKSKTGRLRTKRSLILFAGAAFLLGSFIFLKMAAADGPTIDMNRKGSLNISYRESDDGNDPIRGAVFKLYRVAVPEQKVSGYSVGFNYRSLIRDKSGNLIPINSKSTAENIEEAAAAAYSKGSKTGVGSEGFECKAETDGNGRASAKDLPPGIYLVLEKKAAKGHLPGAPFLVSIPYTFSFVKDGKKYMAWKTTAYAEPKPVSCGNLVIAKYLKGARANRRRKFHFQISISVSGKYHYKKSNGKEGWLKSGGRISLKGGQSAVIDTIPVGAAFMVKEIEANRDGYVTTSQGTSGKIARKKASRAVFVNQLTVPVSPTVTPTAVPTRPSAPERTKSTAPVKTGDTNPVLLYLLLATGSGLILTLASVKMVRARRKR